MPVAINDNQTLAEFEARAEPKPSIALMHQDDPTAIHYVLMGEPGQWGLVRVGMTKLSREMEPTFAAFPAAASPHPLCPENRLAGMVPAGMVRGAPPSKAKKPLPSYLRVVA
jgi:hypothetical protein